MSLVKFSNVGVVRPLCLFRHLRFHCGEPAPPQGPGVCSIPVHSGSFQMYANPLKIADLQAHNVYTKGHEHMNKHTWT